MQCEERPKKMTMPKADDLKGSSSPASSAPGDTPPGTVGTVSDEGKERIVLLPVPKEEQRTHTAPVFYVQQHQPTAVGSRTGGFVVSRGREAVGKVLEVDGVPVTEITQESNLNRYDRRKGEEMGLSGPSGSDRTRMGNLGMFGPLSHSDFDDIPDDFVLPPGNVRKGQKYFKKHCWVCHSIYPDNRMGPGQFPLGPTLFNIYGRASGHAEIHNKQGQHRVTDILWVDAPLMNYMKNPRQAAQGFVQMNFRGIIDIQMRVDIIHYLKTLDWSNEELANPKERPSGSALSRWYGYAKESMASKPEENEKSGVETTKTDGPKKTPVARGFQ